MASIKTGRRYKGGPISLRAISLLEHADFPAHLRPLTELGTQGFKGKLRNGDVDCDWDFRLFSNGSWNLSATAHDSGEILGDHFVLECVINDSHGVGQSIKRRLGTDDTVHSSLNGSDPWIRENWQSIKGVTAHLTVSPDWPVIAAYVGIALTIGGIVVTGVLLSGRGSNSGSGDTWTFSGGQDENGPFYEGHRD